MCKEWESKLWLRKRIVQMWRVTGGEGGPQRRRRDKVKGLLLGRGLSERERMRLARDRDVWVGMISE